MYLYGKKICILCNSIEVNLYIIYRYGIKFWMCCGCMRSYFVYLVFVCFGVFFLGEVMGILYKYVKKICILCVFMEK